MVRCRFALIVAGVTAVSNDRPCPNTLNTLRGLGRTHTAVKNPLAELRSASETEFVERSAAQSLNILKLKQIKNYKSIVLGK